MGLFADARQEGEKACSCHESELGGTDLRGVMFQNAWEVNAGLAKQPAPDLTCSEDERAGANRGVRWERESIETVQKVRNCIGKFLKWLPLEPCQNYVAGLQRRQNPVLQEGGGKIGKGRCSLGVGGGVEVTAAKTDSTTQMNIIWPCKLMLTDKSMCDVPSS